MKDLIKSGLRKSSDNSKMLKFLSLVALILNTKALADKKCSGLMFDGKYYDVEIVKDGINNLHHMILNTNDNTLYFIFEQMTLPPIKNLGYLNLDNRDVGVISDVRNATSVAIDQTRNIVYAGGADGLFIINYNKVPESTPVYESIESLFFKDELYYTNKWKTVSKFSYGTSTGIKELEGIPVDDLIVDDSNNVFFLQDETKLFVVQLGTRAINSFESYVVHHIAADIYYRPFIITNRGVYKYNKYKYAFDNVSKLRNFKALTFSKTNEPVYVVNDLIVKLKYNPIQCYED